MAKQVQLRRGTTAENDAFTGADGELSFDTTLDQVRVHNGATAGGFNLVKWVDVPASAGASGNVGDASYASGYLYVCVAANTWQRVAIATW